MWVASVDHAHCLRLGVDEEKRAAMSTGFTDAPTETEFLAAFGVDPMEAAPQDGFWCYSFESAGGEVVRFSFDVHQRSVQTELESNGRVVCTVVHENADHIRIIEGADQASIMVEFANAPDECRTQLRLRVFPDLEISWSSLRA